MRPSRGSEFVRVRWRSFAVGLVGWEKRFPSASIKQSKSIKNMRKRSFFVKKTPFGGGKNHKIA
jgi:hypothetical protein